MAQLSDDCFANDGRLLRVDEAEQALRERVPPLERVERLPLVDALGRVLAEDLISPVDIPPRDNSAVDGYAVRFADLSPDGETVLPVIGRATAGHPFAGGLQPGTALRIFTGALMPDAADTVLMQEDCRELDGTVTIAPGIGRGANRRLRGEDVSLGSRVMGRGHRLRPQDVGQAAALGRRELLVSARPRVALFSTGDELVEPGAVPGPGQIHDSNRFTLAALLAASGCAVTDLGILRDSRTAIRDALAAAARDHDLVITSGGVSVGEEDHVKAAVEELGGLHFWRLAIKPGRPIALGQIGDVPFVGLPGNPVAVVVTFLVLVRPLLLRLQGALDRPLRRFPVSAGFRHRKKRERREWLRASLAPGSPLPVAHRFPRDGAGILSSLVQTDGLVELPEDLTQLEEGATVSFLPYSELLA